MQITQKDVTLMHIAKSMGALSIAERKKVGALIVKDRRIIATGYNGLPAGMPGKCEDDQGNTLPGVIHAEDNALIFAISQGINVRGCDIYISLSPCLKCASRIISAGIRNVYFGEYYRSDEGIALLERNKIPCTFIDLKRYKAKV